MIFTLNQLNLSDYFLPDNPLMPNLTALDNTPDETWVVVEGKSVLACASLWFSSTPCFADKPTAFLGHFFTVDELAGRYLLTSLKQRASALGVYHLIGPINGDTWHSYRLLSVTSEVEPFLLDLSTPLAWNTLFEQSGFGVIKRYHSSMAASGGYEDRSVERFAPRMQTLELTVRPFDISYWQEELTRLYPLCCASFSRNFLYSDIDLTRFIQLYQPVLPLLDPELFLIVETTDKPIGFVFAYPNLTQKPSAEKVDSVVLKTVARSSKRIYAGLGAYLVHEIHVRAAAKGYASVIHAFMAEGNASGAISDKSARIIRQYALYGCAL